ncbi:oxidoreductase [Alicyclobacillus vulcanalis]|uniref:Short-chain dehydrogenase n=1 Tax=Alicyclobacillus vulcanalis TaxID=252246 RepID=A0A1N7MDE7_9BACL|nr:oxidoreductase [Alicyclobacillus vulcanalis]SIS84062.1 Short-chain dehydrogenase [Alicyclobacillus vulcanalis]
MGFTADQIPNQGGRWAVITGANSGIGWEAARALARRGAKVTLAVRNASRGEAAADRIRSEVPNAELDVRVVDLADLDSVEAFADALVAEGRPLDLLINNAGVMATSYGTTRQGFELQFGTNHLGHFALTLRLLPILAGTTGARVVTVSSMAHQMAKHLDLTYVRGGGSYRRFESYAQSKLANLLFAYELDRRLKKRGLPLKSIACHPGFAATSLVENGMLKRAWQRPFARLVNVFAQPSDMGALPTLYAATHPDLAGGEYVGPDRGSRGYPAVVASSPASRDVTAARELWTASLDMTGIPRDAWYALEDE